MPTNRVPVRHSRKIMVTDEMVELFKTGLEILRAGDDEHFEDDTPAGRRREYLDIYKRLNWTLLRRAPHEASVFDSGIAEGEPPPLYMAIHDNGRFHGWDTALVQRAALMDALKKRNRQDGER
jgi:hypothetical protein